MNLSANKKNWRIKAVDEDRVSVIRRRYGISDFLAQILSSRLNNDEDICHFLEPKLKYLMPDPYHLLDMDKAVSRILSALKHKEKIYIFADYDVDGATSSSLLKSFFRDLGHDVGIYVPDRIQEGYGPSKIGMQRIKDMGASLVITVDCGTMAHEALDFAHSIGLDVIVIDHHLNNDILPKAVAIVNPNRLDENSQYGYLAAVGVTFLVVSAILSALKKYSLLSQKKMPNLLSYLDLVALGTVCDVMPLIKLNRVYVAQGIKIMTKTQNIGLKALQQSSGINEKISCFHLGYILGPRINAGGRVGKADLGANLLASTCEVEAKKIASELEKHNNERKVLELVMQERANIIAEAQADKNLLFIAEEGWHPGVIGIIAGKIKEKYNKPVAVIALNDGVGKASCRSVKDVDFGVKILKAKQQDLLLAGGGHSMAAGFTVAQDKLADLQIYLENLFDQDFANKDRENFSEYNFELTPSSVNEEFLRELSRLEPFGVSNYEPLFKIANLFVLKADIVGNKHIRCTLALSHGKRNSRNSYSDYSNDSSYLHKPIYAIAFNSVGSEIEKILLNRKPLNMDVIGTFKENVWQGRSSIQMQIKDLIINSL